MYVFFCKPEGSIQSIPKLIELVLTKITSNSIILITSKNLLLLWGHVWSPAYASLFMGKFEKDFLESSDVQPFLWFRFLDDIFMMRRIC